jgi:hypothetical protein
VKTIVVRQRSVIERLSQQVIDAMPATLKGLLGGPANRLNVEGRHAELQGKHKRWRPIDVIVSPTDVLKRRMPIPAEGRSELRHAIALFVRSITPFSPDELLIHAIADKDRSDGDMLSYTIRMLPKGAVLAALKQQRLPRRGIRSITIDHGSPEEPVDFVEALVPSRRWRKWLPALPVVALLLIVSIVCAGRLGDLGAREALLEDQASQGLAHVRVLTDQLDKQRLAGTTQQATIQAFNNAQSAFLLFTDIRATLPAGTELLRVELRQDGARLTIRTANALQVAKAFAAALPKRDASIDGGISADPSSGLENAVILLKPRS